MMFSPHLLGWLRSQCFPIPWIHLSRYGICGLCLIQLPVVQNFESTSLITVLTTRETCVQVMQTPTNGSAIQTRIGLPTRVRRGHDLSNRPCGILHAASSHLAAAWLPGARSRIVSVAASQYCFLPEE